MMKKTLIGIALCTLMIVSTALPISSTTVSKTAANSLSRGNTLYVGGSGPGNYTKIQDAIDNASDGDTVFVYDDSSPYVENLEINTSISLIGENKDTTIINGSINGSGDNFNVTIGVSINADNVTVRGFTIQSCNLSGIVLFSNNSSITDNILSNNYNGIGMGSGDSILTPGYNTIKNNLLIRDEVGLYVSGGRDNIITGNVFSQTDAGIMVVLSMNNNISNNVISEGQRGVLIIGSYNTILYRNNISYNENVGVETMFTSSDKILQNNFIGNNISAKSAQSLWLKLQLFKKELNLPIRRNVWNGNYWDGPRLLPYKIPGFFLFKFQVDWHPAQTPYDIPTEM
jgi:parallel beta-helix repeat protein